MLGEAEWRERPVGGRVVADLLAKRTRLPDVAPEPTVAIWAPGGVADRARVVGAVGFDVEALVAG